MRIREHGLHYHVIARCNYGERIFACDYECELFLDYAGYYFDKHKSNLFQYSVMPTHVHMMLMTTGAGTLDQLIHDICLCYSRDYNRRNGRSGHLWRHHYRSKIIGDDCYALACMRYQDRNAQTAGLVVSPDQWKWSGYNFYANGVPNKLITPHPSYLSLADDPAVRRLLYKSMVCDDQISSRDERILFESFSRQTSKRHGDALLKVTRIIRAQLDTCLTTFNTKPLSIDTQNKATSY